ncbi:hypothetical protein ZWY2020_029174 [Hordeum vulgare]|nr:hypothetical protein ZWY2020_029174 [Hordeum vulgare]
MVALPLQMVPEWQELHLGFVVVDGVDQSVQARPRGRSPVRARSHGKDGALLPFHVAVAPGIAGQVAGVRELSHTRRRTSSPPCRWVLVVADADLGQRFKEKVDAILPPPVFKSRTEQRKTMVGLTIIHTGGFALHRTSVRLCAARNGKSARVAKAAEALVCRGLGITKNGQDVIVEMLNAFTDRFKEKLPQEVIIAMRGIFKLDDSGATVVEDTLLLHGGGGALEVDNGQDAI